MNPITRIFLTIFCVLLIGGCTGDGIGECYTVQRVIKNSSDFDIQLRQYYNQDVQEAQLLTKDSVIYTAFCQNIRGFPECFSEEYSYVFVLAEEDSINIEFNNERILRFDRESISICCSRNILKLEPQWGYSVNGQGTSQRTYTYEITNEDYEMAEPYD